MNLLAEISRLTAQVFFDGLWQGIALAAAVAICFRLYPRVSAPVRFAIWSFAFALALVTPLLHLNLFSAHSANTSATVVQLGAVWGYSIAGIWAVLMAVRAVRLAAHVGRLLRIWRRATPIVSEGNIGEALRNSKRSVELCSSSDVDSPSVIGFWSARLLIPEWLLAKLTPEDLLQVVLHELEHLRRRDDWINLMQKISLVLFPINPALLWMDRRLTLERELACDAGVVASTAAPFGYATCLTRLAEHRLHYRSLALSLSAWSRQSELTRRVHCLLNPVHRLSPLQTKFAAVLLGLVLAGGGLEMARAPQLVSFADSSSAPLLQASTSVVRSRIAPTAVPAMYRDASRPHATLVDAVMPARNSHPLSPAVSTRRRRVTTHLHKAHVTGVPKQPGLLLTTASVPSERFASDSREQIVRTLYVLPTGFPPSYAAVAFRDGWLIIQL
jgi:beta-lactamase regulating signal transducer with metallopeptidase domain